MLLAALPLALFFALQEPEAKPAPLAYPARVQVTGRVVTEGGRHFEDLQVAEIWSFGPGTGESIFPLPIDMFGRFFGSVNVVNGTVTLVAGAQGGAFAGVVVADVPPGDHPRLTELEIPLRSARRVRGRVFAPTPRSIKVGGRTLPREPIEFMFILEPQGAHVGSAVARGDELDTFLPPGDYSWWTFGRGIADRNGTCKVRVGPGIEDLGVLEFDLSTLARLQGGPAPEWVFSEQRGLPEGRTKLADQRGRWLLLLFFAFDDGASGQRLLPRLAEFWRGERTDAEASFEIVAIHGPGAESLQALDETLAPVRKARWGDEPLPFPVLVDPRGESAGIFGVKGYPTMILIDPEGRVVGSAELEDLVAALRSTLESAGDSGDERKR